ncbi:SIS domain-containing protein [Acidisphaera sp. L21]|uniref:SIS domain-containing protein n=1 Tax=Acidisphaera sp. L21 TaxID=1641851 RepID=UPI00131A8021|nr:SIS domain-containing protein [Acidisphaera sp. L21]
MTAEGVPAGELMAADIAEQPRLWRALLARRAEFATVAAKVAAHPPRFVLLAARGTSDHAALYAKYLVEILLGLPAGLVSPSTMTAYATQPHMRDVLLLVVSQSGHSPDLVRTVETGRRGGALTIAVTNTADSPLARAAQLHLDVGAGTERAVAATKSYTAQLLALYLLVDHIRGRTGAAADRVPDLGEALLAKADLAPLATRYRFAQRMVLTGRGYAYPTAREAGLKLMETSYISAQAFSGADLLHGPLAMLDAQIPVLAIVPSGVAGAAMEQVLPRIRTAGADLFVVGSQEAVAQADAGFVLPPGAPEELSPLLEILPFQLLAIHLALIRGENPDAPRSIRKITDTM